jgi:inosose dehydratase
MATQNDHDKGPQMQNKFPRRQFLTTITAATAATLLPRALTAAPKLLYPPIDLAYFNTPIPTAASAIKYGYAAITWGRNDRQAIEDISALGFPGIQLRSNCIEEFNNDPSVVRDLLAKHKLTFVALSSGGLSIDRPASDELAKHTAHAKFVHDAGGLYLQVTDDRPKDRAITPDDQKKLGQLMTELGKRTADLGVSLGYHNHMGSLGERPDDVARILEATDPRYAKLELDIAHYFQGGGDPVKAILDYGDRLLFLHIKDVERLKGEAPPKNYRFVELGRGKVPLPAVFTALRTVNFRGWAIIELDEVPDRARTPKESAEISWKYLTEKLHIA